MKTHQRIVKPSSISAIALLAGGWFLASAASAQDRTEGQDLVLRLYGARSWAVECTLDTERGRVSRPDAKGRGSVSSGTIVGRDTIGGACTAEASNRGPLEMRLDDPDGHFVCPFGDRAEDGECKSVLPAGETLEIAIQLS